MEHHDPLSGLVRLHIPHPAEEHLVYGQWMIDELARHGSRISPRTLYPMPPTPERDGCLTGATEREGRTSRRFHAITDKGRGGPAVARARPDELKEAGAE